MQLQYSNQKLSFESHLGFGVNAKEESEFLTDYDLDNYKYLTFLWLNKKFFKDKLQLSILAISDGNQQNNGIDSLNNPIKYPDSINFRYTFGPYLNFKSGKIDLTGSFYDQTGTSKEGKNINAHFYSGMASYHLIDRLKLLVGYDHSSGSNITTKKFKANETNTFDNLFGTEHKNFGLLDYFAQPSQFHAGINDLYFKIDFKFNWVNRIEISYHLFSLDEANLFALDSSGTEVQVLVNKDLGSEIDFELFHSHREDAWIRAGYSIIFPYTSLEVLKFGTLDGIGKSELAHFAWIQVQIKPTIFFSQIKNNK